MMWHRFVEVNHAEDNDHDPRPRAFHAAWADGGREQDRCRQAGATAQAGPDRPRDAVRTGRGRDRGTAAAVGPGQRLTAGIPLWLTSWRDRLLPPSTVLIVLSPAAPGGGMLSA